jgi:hypothetical protein
LIYDEIKLAFGDEDPNYQHSALTVLMAILQSKGSISDILKVSTIFFWFIISLDRGTPYY